MPLNNRESQTYLYSDNVAPKQYAEEMIKSIAAGINPIILVLSNYADLLIYEFIEQKGYLLPKSQQNVWRQAAEKEADLAQQLCPAGSDRKFVIVDAAKGDASIQNSLKAAYVGIVRVKQLQEAELAQKWLLDNKKIKYANGVVSCRKDRESKMDINSEKIEQIVKEVLQGMSDQPSSGAKSAKPTGGAIPKTSRVAMLTALEHYDLKEFPIPEVGDDDILVKVEGCGVCGTDAHEFKRDPFGLIPVALGHEGTGEIVKMGKNVTKDSAGKPLAVGDKVVTCMIFKDNPDITMFDLNKQNVGGADVYGLLPDDDIHLNGWFADYILVRKGSTIFNVSDLSLDLRILIEPCAVLIHAVERAKTTGILRFNSRVVVQGCGPIGLICIAILRTMGIENIVAVDGEDKRLAFAKEMGADRSVNFKNYKGIEELTEAVKDAFGGYQADFAFQCTGSPVAHANVYKFIRNGGGLCELGFFINGGDATINPHFDICAKEITTVGSWVYTLRDYATTFDFLKRAKGIGLPLEKLITHKFPLEQINEAHVTNLKMEGLKIAIVNQ